MANVTNDISELKKLLKTTSTVISVKPKENEASTKPNKGEALFHSYVRGVVDNSEIYEIMKDTRVDGLSFRTILKSCKDDLSKDIVEYFACCFFEGEYSLLDALARQYEKDANSNENANILGHDVNMTNGEVLNLLSALFKVALAIDKRMFDKPEQVQIVYNPSYKNPLSNNTNSAVKAQPKNISDNQTREGKDSPVIKKAKKESKPKQNKSQDALKKFLANATYKSSKTRSGSTASYPGMKRSSFASHVAKTGVWGKIASYGGFNGPLIYINAGHGR